MAMQKRMEKVGMNQIKMPKVMRAAGKIAKVRIRMQKMTQN